MSEHKSVFWISIGKGEITDQASDELKNALMQSGLKPYQPMKGGDGGVLRDVALLILNIDEPWRSIFIGVLASRLDRLIVNATDWFKKQPAFREEGNTNYVIELYVYRHIPFGSTKTTVIKVPIRKPLSIRELKKILKSN